MESEKKVIASLKKYDEVTGKGFLYCEDISPNDVFLSKQILINHKIPNSIKAGDKFEVCIIRDNFKGKPSWKIKTISLFQMRNFSSHIFKRIQFFQDDIFLKEQRKNSKKEISKLIHKKFEIKKINIGEHKIHIQRKSESEFKENIRYDDKLNFNFGENIFFKNIADRHYQNANLLADHTQCLSISPAWRMIVGLGTDSVFETGITLHHIYGFPYIPASAIKGLLRNYLIHTFWGNGFDREAKAFNESKWMCDIFGCPEQTTWKDENENVHKKDTFYKKTFDEDAKTFGKERQLYRYGFAEKAGDIIFFDAYPNESPTGKIKADIMNPHYGEYYEGKKDENGQSIPPADYLSPIPILFLTVTNLSFTFIIGVKKGKEDFQINIKDTYVGNVSEVVIKILKDALTNHGIGAKTAVGYGYFH